MTAFAAIAHNLRQMEERDKAKKNGEDLTALSKKHEEEDKEFRKNIIGVTVRVGVGYVTGGVLGAAKGLYDHLKNL